MRTFDRLALALVAPAALAASSVAARAEDTGEKVEYHFTDATTDFGNLHLSANLLGYQLSSPGDGLVTTLNGIFELSQAFVVRAHAAFPFLVGVGSADGPVRLEGGIALHSTSFDVEMEQAELERTDTQVKYINVPVVNRNSKGLGVGVIYRDNAVETKIGGKEGVDTRAQQLTLYAGLSTINSAGYSLSVKNHKGSFLNYRFVAAGLDALFDVVQSYGKKPDDAPGRFGGRLWAESIFGTTFGLSGRLEIGYFPGDTGFYLLASIGVGLNLHL
ncbi:MAG: hypothetical protein U1F43_02900 [Myxococcota bacterium]